MPLNLYAQNFTNHGLEDTIALSSYPDNWTNVPFTDVINLANGAAQTIPDVCGTSGPSIVSGVRGNPHGGNSFVSGIYAESYSGIIFHEGIQQTVTGFNTSIQYQLSFYQTVVKQINTLDTSGSWAVYMDNTLLLSSIVSSSTLPYNSNSLVWDYDTITFTPTSTTHTFKFIPVDDDLDQSISSTDSAGALRMGIDDINLVPFIDCANTFSIGNDTTLCAGDSIDLMISGVNNFSFLWSNGDANSFTRIYSPGTYWVQADSGSCSYYDTIVISPPLTSIEVLGNDTTLCINDSITLDATDSGISYVWNDNSNDPTLKVFTSGQYFVDLTTVNGCLYTDSIQIDYFVPPNFDLGNDTSLCQETFITLDATTQNASYLWYDSSIASTITINSEDTVSIILTQNNCQYYDTIIIDYQTPIIDFLGTDSVFCVNDSILLDPQLGASSYLWSNNSVDSASTFYVADTVWLEIVKNGCNYIDSIILTNYPLYLLDIGNDTTLCINDSITLDATETTNASYVWNDYSNNPTLKVFASGQYFVDLTTVNGCFYTDSIQIDYFQPPILNLGNDTTLCQDASLTLDANTLNASYLWNDGSTASTFGINSEDTISIILTQNSCQYFDTIVVDFVHLPNLDLGPDTTLCPGDSILLSIANTTADILWSNLDTDSATVIHNQGSSWVTLSKNGCITSDTINIANFNAPSVNLGPDTVLCESQNISWNILQNGASYLWNDNSTGPTNSINQSGTVFVTLTDINSCKATDTVQVGVISLNVDLGPDLLLCENDSVEISAFQSTNVQYIWNDNSTNSSLMIKNPGTYYVTVSELNCTSTDSVIIDYSMIDIEFDSETLNCAFDIIEFENTTQISPNDNIINYYWDFGNGDFSESETPLMSYKLSGSYDITLHVESFNGCIDQLKKDQYININEKPSANFSYGITERGAIDIKYFFESLSNKADTWSWYIDSDLVSTDSVFNYTFYDNFSNFKEVTLVVYTDDGCSDSLSKFVEINQNTLVYAPNAFTPFSSGNLNNIFKPIVSTGIKEDTYHLMIFNRWGEIIFESRNPEIGWDGTYNGNQMATSAYVWLLKFEESVSEELQTVTGNVTIIR